MDGAFLGAAIYRPTTTLQRFITDRATDRRSLYWRDSLFDSGGDVGVALRDDRALHVAAGSRLSFDTYFNVFFEAQWLRHTRLRSINLEMTVCGTALIRIYRHALGRKALVHEQLVGSGTVKVDVSLSAINFRQNGFLSAELCATDGPFSFVSGAWTTDDTSADPVNLAAVFCTFNREADIGRVLQSIATDGAVQDSLAQVFVVNQGRPDLARVPIVADAAEVLGSRLTVLEQGNFGGAGGFSRGLLAALGDPALTHAVLLDDDLELEPDSLLRMAAFFSFATRDFVLGGHMLDMLHPTVLYEAGAVIAERHWEFHPQHFMLDVTTTDALAMLTQPYAVHYNGWWCCGFPLSVLRDHGMPLPCFIRGDDMEFGLRLHQRGVPTVPMPGVAVWHEPFYLKLGGWQLYYETRNLLVAMALHQPFDRLGVVRRIGRQIVVHLLTYRYYSAALVLQGVEDFLAGPDVMRGAPLPRHASLQSLKAAYPPAFTPREAVAHEQKLKTIPDGRLRCFVLLLMLLVRNAVITTCHAPARVLPIDQFHWLTIRSAGHVATETWWDENLPTYQRNREHHRSLLMKAIRLVGRLFRELPQAAAAWRAAAAGLTSVPSWHAYLGVAETAVRTGRETVATRLPAMAGR